jgi:hypothetical protein
MKNSIVILLLCLLSASACKKDKTPAPAPNKNSTQKPAPPSKPKYTQKLSYTIYTNNIAPYGSYNDTARLRTTIFYKDNTPTDTTYSFNTGGEWYSREFAVSDSNIYNSSPSGDNSTEYTLSGNRLIINSVRREQEFSGYFEYKMQFFNGEKQ